MKARRFDEILRARGYKVQEQVKYQGTNVYTKKHKYNVVTCMVQKDSHGKAQDMWFTITSQIEHDREIQKQIDLDASYLYLEADRIHEAFEELKQMKAPKHIYCF